MEKYPIIDRSDAIGTIKSENNGRKNSGKLSFGSKSNFAVIIKKFCIGPSFFKREQTSLDPNKYWQTRVRLTRTLRLVPHCTKYDCLMYKTISLRGLKFSFKIDLLLSTLRYLDFTILFWKKTKIFMETFLFHQKATEP